MISGKVENLVYPKTQIDGRAAALFNDFDIAKDGTIYFSDSSHVILSNSLIEFLGEPTGRCVNLKTVQNSAIISKRFTIRGSRSINSYKCLIGTYLKFL